MELNITDYLTHSQIIEVIESELRNQIREHFKNEQNAQRLLSNLSYEIVQKELNKIVPNYETELIEKTAKLIAEKDLSFHLYNFDHFNGSAKSLGAKIIESTIKENKELIKQKVIESITNKDYSEEAWNKFESLAEQFTSNVYDFVSAMKAKKE